MMTSKTTKVESINTLMDTTSEDTQLKFSDGVKVKATRVKKLTIGSVPIHGALHGEKKVSSTLPSENAVLMTL
jgi:hypothetical protein